MEMLCLQKMNYLKMKKRGLFVEDLCGEIRYFEKVGCGNTFLAQSQKFISVKLQLF